uniref:Uncharacterized protein n=1 Tax=Amphimedon queenslandica TaxID=400682 RepID=A0A1X7T5E3_AMPQE
FLLTFQEQEMLVPAVDNYTKAANLMNVIQKQLESSLNPEQYLIDICHVLINQQHRTLTDIATSILHQLGQSIPDNVSSHTVLPSPVDDVSNTPVTNIRGNIYFVRAGATAATSNVANTRIFKKIRDKIRTTFGKLPYDVQGYADNMRQHYKDQPIVATDWPPRIGKDFFGRLAL